MEAAQTTWRPLGELIVERGLITQEQLEDALLEQRITNKRLGTILIDKGIVTAQALTDALVDHELEEARAELAGLKEDLAHQSAAHSRAEEEIGRLHALIDERDAGLTAMESTIEELRGIGAATQTELDDARAQLERVRGELETAQHRIAETQARLVELDAEHTARVEQLEADSQARLEELQDELRAKTEELTAVSADHERRGTRIFELESQVAELAENLSATDETLGIEMHAREQAQRESKRLHEELDERDARVAKLARQVEALEAELKVVVAEREQSQRKLRSRERRVTKLESMLAELRAVRETAPAQSPNEAERAEVDGPEVGEPGPQEPEAVAEAPEPQPQAPEPAAPVAESEADGFLYFVPRTGEGYELVEQPGSAPAVGDTVEFEGRNFEVRRHSRSPLPFDRRVCVYLRVS